MTFNVNGLRLDAQAEVERLVEGLRAAVVVQMRRRGAVLGVSGGVDSAVTLALCVRAFGPQAVTALFMPEKDSDPLSRELAFLVTRQYGVEPIVEDITATLEGAGCYARRDAAIRQVFPEYNPASGYKAKLVLPNNLLEENTYNVSHLTIIAPDGTQQSKRAPLQSYLQIVAASNFKQRTRMAMVYYYAELHNYAVMGTANKNEHDQGFFVKHGDAGCDVQPIVHLFKTQVYQMAEYLGVPAEIRTRPPTSDTYSAPCTQEEFFFRLPFELMDRLWLALEQGAPAGEAAAALGLSEAQVQRAYDDLIRKAKTTDFLRLPPVRFGNNKI